MKFSLLFSLVLTISSAQGYNRYDYKKSSQQAEAFDPKAILDMIKDFCSKEPETCKSIAKKILFFLPAELADKLIGIIIKTKDDQFERYRSELESNENDSSSGALDDALGD